MTLMPLLLLAVCPPAVLVMWAVVVHRDGSILRFGLDPRSIFSVLPLPSWTAVQIIAVFAVTELALLLGLPGRVEDGPRTPRGNRPRYRLNGVAAFLLTHALFWLGVALHAFPASVAYDHHGEILATLCVFALVLCLALTWKAKHRPSSSDVTRTGNVLFDYFQGMELHPRILGVDLKQLCNCRLAMMGWSVLVVSFACAQRARDGHFSYGMLVAVALQLAYILKFFVWELGYFHSLDIMHDRFGFYICWGVLCWVPALYTLSTFFLVTHADDLSPMMALALLAVGLVALATNYDADRQRQRVRAANGRLPVWGREPTCIVARYTCHDGTEHQNLLLASGYWGLARHFHYLPEITLALAWSIPCGFHHALPYFYLTFLTVLLVDRAGRDDLRCEKKYGPAWHEYRRLVPYKIIPGVF